MTGVNVSGYLRTESGVGDLARRYVRAIRHLGVPVALNDLSALSGNRADDRSLGAFTNACPHDVNLVCIDVQQQYALLNAGGRAWLDGRYNIGVWLWELPEFPAKWHDRFAYYDEIWVPSSFIANALTPVSPVPVVTLPPVLTVAERGSRERGRTRLGAAPDEFIVLFVFDVNSTIARKNPCGAIDAFRRAFAPADRARLVIKFVNGASDAAGVRDMQARAAGHNISLLEGYWPAADVRDLFEACDAYLSLHRSEGLGLTVTDAMALGKPVIATDWSGTRDFVTMRNGFPIGYSPGVNPRKAGPYPKDAVWAEPSAAHAAHALRWIFEHRDRAARQGAAARQDIEAAFSEDAVAARLRTRFDAIANIRRGSHYRADMRRVYARYQELGADLAALVDQHVPADARVAVISKGDDRLLAFGDRDVSHFPQLEDGRYAGYHPHDSASAIAHLEQVRARGVEWLVIPETASWWLTHYPDFAAHLLCGYTPVVTDAAVGTIVNLLAPAGAAASSEELWEVGS
jgi:glycosyltransferase involved in cell wall biosynthesis